MYAVVYTGDFGHTVTEQQGSCPRVVEPSSGALPSDFVSAGPLVLQSMNTYVVRYVGSIAHFAFRHLGIMADGTEPFREPRPSLLSSPSCEGLVHVLPRCWRRRRDYPTYVVGGVCGPRALFASVDH